MTRTIAILGVVVLVTAGWLGSIPSSAQQQTALQVLLESSEAFRQGQHSGLHYEYSCTGDELLIYEEYTGETRATISHGDYISCVAIWPEPPTGATEPHVVAVAGIMNDLKNASIAIYADLNGNLFQEPSEQVALVDIGDRVPIGLGGLQDRMVFYDYATLEMFTIEDTDDDGIADTLVQTPFASFKIPLVDLGIEPIIHTGTKRQYKVQHYDLLSGPLLVTDDDDDGIADEVIEMAGEPTPPRIWNELYDGAVSARLLGTGDGSKLVVLDETGEWLGSGTQNGTNEPALVPLSRPLVAGEDITIQNATTKASHTFPVLPITPLQPVIVSTDKYQAESGEVVTLSGEGFSSTAQVFIFGRPIDEPVEATVVSVTSDSIAFLVPAVFPELASHVKVVNPTATETEFDIVAIHFD